MAEEQSEDRNHLTPPISSTEEEHLEMILQKIETGSYDKMTPEHIGEILAQRKSVNEYIHQENMQNHERFKIAEKNKLIYFGSILGFALIILGLVVWSQAQNLMQVLQMLLIFIGGIGFGKVVEFPQFGKESK